MIQVGNTQEIYYRPVNRFVADFIGESNFLHGNLARNGVGPILELAGGEARLPVRSTAREGPATLMIRPESVGIGEPGTEGVKTLAVLPFDFPRGDTWLVVMMSFVLAGAGALACAAPLKRALELRPLDWLRDS